MRISQFIKFLGVGTVNTAVTYILYLLLLFIFSYQISYTITYIFGVWLSYWLNLKFVFQEVGSVKKMVLFPLVYVIQYVLGLFILYIIINKFNIAKEIAPIFVVLITTPIIFILTRKVLTSRRL